MAGSPLYPWSPAPLGEGLVGVADSLRQLYTTFGLRPRRVFLVWIGWTIDVDGDGASFANTPPIIREGTTPEVMLEAIREVDLDRDVVGVGRPVLLREVEILPTPLVSSLTSISKDADAVGATERGTITVSQISASFSEDFLTGLACPFVEDGREGLLPGVEFFYEIRENRAAGFIDPGFVGQAGRTQEAEPTRRRFAVVGVPERMPDRFEWVVNLRRADGERDRDGSFEEV